jgi:hypothetical protein
MNQQKIRELAGRSGGHFYFESLASRPAQKREGVSFTFERLEAFAKLVASEVIAKEREACARVCDDLSTKHTWEGCYANECAEAIRARGTNE